MSVYVDRPRSLWRGKLWGHMMADSLDELHAFAKALGLRREWFQGDHYDLTATRFEKALNAGAQLVESRALVGLRRAARVKA